MQSDASERTQTKGSYTRLTFQKKIGLVRNVFIQGMSRNKACLNQSVPKSTGKRYLKSFEDYISSLCSLGSLTSQFFAHYLQDLVSNHERKHQESNVRTNNENLQNVEGLQLSNIIIWLYPATDMVFFYQYP